MKNTILQTISAVLGHLFSCQEINQWIRIRTPYLYPDRDVIDFYCKASQNFYWLTDLGETTRWLMSQSGSDSLSKRQDELIEEILLTHQVEERQGTLAIQVENIENFPEAIVHLAQATIAISSLWVLCENRSVPRTSVSRTYGAPTIKDQFFYILKENRINFTRNSRFRGRSGRNWQVDFHIQQNHIYFVKVLSASSPAIIKTKANDAIAAWEDLKPIDPKNPDQKEPEFISLLNDTIAVWPQEIICQLNKWSQIIFWSDHGILMQQILVDRNGDSVQHSEIPGSKSRAQYSSLYPDPYQNPSPVPESLPHS